MTDRQYNYTLQARDSYSAVFNDFLEKTRRIRGEWKALRQELSKPTGARETAKEFQAIGGTSAQLRAVARSLRDIASSLNRVRRAGQGAATNIQRVSRSSATAASNLQSANAATGRIGTSMGNLTKTTGGWLLRLQRSLVILGRILGILLVFRSLQFGAQIFTAGIREAFKFSESIKQAELSIRGLIAQLGTAVDAQGRSLDTAEKFAAAQGVARDQVRKLRIEALKTSATFAQLLDTFQVGLAPGVTAGLNFDQIRRITVLISQAATAIGLQQNQLSEEIRSILTGTITPRTTRIATALGIDNADIRRAKEAGELFEFLTERLEAFGITGAKGLELVSNQLINLRDFTAGLLAEGLTPFFDEFQDIIEGISDNLATIDQDTDQVLINPEVLAVAGQFGNALTSILQTARAIAVEFGVDGLRSALTTAATSAAAFQAFLTPVGRIAVGLVRGFTAVSSATARTAQFLADVASRVLDAEIGITSVLRVLQGIAAVLGGILSISLTLKATQLAIVAATGAWRGILLLISPIMFAIQGAATGVSVAVASATGGLSILLALLVASAVAIALANAEFRNFVATVATELPRIILSFLDEVLVAGQVTAKVLQAAFEFGFEFAKAKASEFANFTAKLLASAIPEALDALPDLAKSFLGISDADIKLIRFGLRGVQEDGLELEETYRSLQETFKKASDELANFQPKKFFNIDPNEVDKSLAAISLRFVDLFNTIDGLVGGLLGEDFVSGLVPDEEDNQRQAVFLQGLEEYRRILDEISEQAREADQALELTSATAGLRGLARESARIRTTIAQSFEDTRNNLESLLTGFRNQLNSLVEEGLGSSPEAARLELQIQALENSLRGLATEETKLFQTRLANLDREANLKDRFAQEDRSARLAVLRATVSAEAEGLNNLQAGRERSFRVNAVRLEQERALNASIFQEQISGLGQVRAFELATGSDRTDTLTRIAQLQQARLDQLQEEQLLLQQNAQQLERLRAIASDPVGEAQSEFIRELEDPQQTFQAALGIFRFFHDGLAQALSSALVDGLFDQEAELFDKIKNFAKRAAQLVLDEFIKANILRNLFGAGSSVDPNFVGPINQQAAGGFVPGGTKFENLRGMGTDTVLSALTPDEFVVPKAQASKGSRAFWEGIRTGRINVSQLERLARGQGRLPSAPAPTSRSKRRYQAGGFVGSGSLGSGSGGTTVVNVFSEEQLAAAMAGSRGRRVILNTVGGASEELR